MSVPANFFNTTTITASPGDAAETIIATLPGVNELLPGLPIHLRGSLSVSLDADCATATARIRRTGLTGTVCGLATSEGPDTVADLAGITMNVDGTDEQSWIADAVYVLTLECAGASGAGSVVGLYLEARVG